MIKNYLIKGSFICMALITLILIVDHKVEERIATMQKINHSQTR